MFIGLFIVVAGIEKTSLERGLVAVAGACIWRHVSC